MIDRQRCLQWFQVRAINVSINDSVTSRFCLLFTCHATKLAWHVIFWCRERFTVSVRCPVCRASHYLVKFCFRINKRLLTSASDGVQLKLGLCELCATTSPPFQIYGTYFCPGGGGYWPVSYIFRIVSSSLCSVLWHATPRITVFEIFVVQWPKFRSKSSDLRTHLGHRPPKVAKTCPGLICTTMQNFTPIGATVAEGSNKIPPNKMPLGQNDNVTYGG